MKTYRTLTGFAATGAAAIGLLLAAPGPAAKADGFTLQPDCQNNPYPSLCNDMVNQLIGELTSFNAVFAHPNAEQAAAFYHPLASLYTTATGQFYIGRDNIQNNYFVPFVASIAHASVNFSTFHYSVIDYNTIVTYGALAASGVLKNGTAFTQPPLPQTLTWVRNDRYDPTHPFLIVSDHE